jgi:hypothetical protein
MTEPYASHDASEIEPLLRGHVFEALQKKLGIVIIANSK